MTGAGSHEPLARVKVVNNLWCPTRVPWRNERLGKLRQLVQQGRRRRFAWKGAAAQSGTWWLRYDPKPDLPGRSPHGANLAGEPTPQDVTAVRADLPWSKSKYGIFVAAQVPVLEPGGGLVDRTRRGRAQRSLNRSVTSISVRLSCR